MLDIGANYGSVGLLAARAVGPTGRVHCFEPQPELAEAIVGSARLNGLSNVSVHAVALSDRDGDAILTVPHGHSGRAYLGSGAAGCVTRTVPLRQTSAFLTQLGLRAVRLIKLDVEGHEEAVISGGIGFLRAAQLPAIVFESHDDGQPLLQREAVRILQSLGYALFQIRQRPLFRVQLKAIHRPGDAEPGYDFVACDRMRAEAELRRICSVV